MRHPVLEDFYSRYPWLDLIGNDGLLMNHARCTHPLTLEKLESAKSDLGVDLAIRFEYDSAWQGFVSRYPEYNVAANRDICFESLTYGQNPSCQAFAELAGQMGSKLTVTEAHKDKSRLAAERLDLIQTITSGQPHYFCWDAAHGKVKGFPAAELSQSSTERLREILSQVQATKEAQQSTREEQREKLKAVPSQFTQYRPIPDKWRVPSTGKEISLDRDSIMKDVRDKNDFRKMLQMFGANKITSILKGEK